MSFEKSFKGESMQKDTLDFYNRNAQFFVTDTKDVQFTEIQDVFLSYLSSGSKILDFGCGSGRDTKYFLDKGYVVDAIDGSEELCKIASAYTGIEVKNSLFEELDAREEYSGIWACASILHIPKEELQAILRKMMISVVDGGIIYASFKYGDFEGFRNGRYFTYLDEDTFTTLIKSISELQIEKMWLSNDVRVGRGEEQWLNVILIKQA